MIIGIINGQDLTIKQPVIASNSIDYLEAKFEFDKSWDEMIKFVHFEQDDISLIFQLDNDMVNKSAHLNLSEGSWDVWVHGERIINGEVVERPTTDIAKIKVKPTGLIEGEDPVPVAPSVGEQILATAIQAKEIAEEAKEIAEKGGGTGENANIFANALKKTLSGHIVGMDDVSPIEHDLDVRVTADELFVFADDFAAQTQNGEVVATVDNGKIVLNGVAGNTKDAIGLPLSSLSKGTYEYNINYSGGATLLFQDSRTGSQIGDSHDLTEGSCTFTLEETTPIWIGVIIRGGLSFSNTVLDISLKREDMSDVKLYRYGKNLFNNVAENIEPIAAVGSSSVSAKNGHTLRLPAGRYTIHAEGVARGDYINTRLVSSDGVQKSPDSSENGNYIVVAEGVHKLTYTVEEGDVLYIFNQSNNMNIQNNTAAIFARYDIQVEVGDTSTPFERFVEPVEFEINEDGTVDNLKSIAPYMTLMTDSSGFNIECTYNRDIIKVVASIEETILSLTNSIAEGLSL